MSDSDSDWDDHDLNAVIDRLRAGPTDSSLSSQATAVESGAVTERVDTPDTTSLKSPNSTSPPPPPPSPSPSPRPQWKRNDRFYMSLVTFRVKDQLFRVPREGFQNGSAYFRKIFTMNEGIPGPHDGDSDSNPINLEGIHEEDFEEFLQLLYPQGPSNPPSSSSEKGSPKWLKILKLAHKWKFNDIREYCISMLENVNFEEVTKIKIAHDFEINSWYLPSYVALANRPRPIGIWEAEKLGFRFSIKMAQVRERRLTRGPKYVDKDDEVLKKDIRELFFLDIDDTSKVSLPCRNSD